MKKISIIIAVYNSSKYLCKCLNSVIMQKGDDIEIIIVDDGSNDNSLDICKEYEKNDRRIKIIHQDNKGLSAVRNIGFDNSTGEYIWHIDGDDYIEKNSVSIIRKYLDKYDIIFFDYNSITDNKVNKTQCSINYENIYDKYILSIPSVWNKVFKRSIFENDKFPSGKNYDDIYIIPSLVNKTKKIIYINEYLYNYVFHNGSLSLVRPFNLDDSLVCLDNVYYKIYKDYPDAAECFYINYLLVYNYISEVRRGLKFEYRKLNKILKNKFPKYYRNKYYNTNFFKKIYIRLVYYDIIILVKFITYLKINIYNNYIRKSNT